MELRQISKHVNRALDILYARDDALLRGNASEWAVAHRFAVYIEEQLPGWNVDCEYNRQGQEADIKRLSSGGIVRPDIVVHHRGRVEKEHNLLVIELKAMPSEADQGRARDYTAAPCDERRFQYQFGVTVVIDGMSKLTWFEAGEIVRPPFYSDTPGADDLLT